jgi:hypothetical protein
LFVLWAVDKTAPPSEYGGLSGSIPHAIRCDFPRICGRNHTEDSQVEASDEILGTHKIGRGNPGQKRDQQVGRSDQAAEVHIERRHGGPGMAPMNQCGTITIGRAKGSVTTAWIR